jgi:hypothetical protein
MEKPLFAEIRARWEEFDSVYLHPYLGASFRNVYIMETKGRPFLSDPTYI